MTYQRDLKKLIVSLDSLTNGQASVKVDEENVCNFTLTIVPNDGPYRNGKFDFEISFDDPSSYPLNLPEVICTTPIYHPNIENDQYDGTNVCLSLFDEWDSNSLADIVQGLLFLFYNPNIEDPLSPLFDGTETEDEFTERVKMSLMGELEIDGVSFTRNQVTDDEKFPPVSNDTLNTNTVNRQEIVDVPQMNNSDDDVLVTTTENISSKVTQKTSGLDNTTESDNNIHGSDSTVAESNNRVTPVSKVTELAATDSVKVLDKQDSICTTINSEPTTSAISPTLNQKNYQTWNMAFRTVTVLLIYIGFVNYEQPFYEIFR